jgi:hypothetical protein
VQGGGLIIDTEGLKLQSLVLFLPSVVQNYVTSHYIFATMLFNMVLPGTSGVKDYEQHTTSILIRTVFKKMKDAMGL